MIMNFNFIVMSNIPFAKALASTFISLILTTSAIVGQTEGDTESKVRKDDKTGILLLAHGGRQNWNEEVSNLAASIDKTIMAEVAFGMAAKRNIQNAVDKLIARGAERIVAVPLFVSSNSSVVTSTEYLIGRRAEAPRDLAIFAKMNHGSGGHGSHNSPDISFDPTAPIKSSVPIYMSPALDDHPIVAEILTSRATALSQQSRSEVVVLVAHGPVSDETNRLWLADMASLANRMRSSSEFKRIEYLTVCDDAPEPIRLKATEELRSVVKRALDEKSRVLIVPLLISYGGIEEGIKKRLNGLEYTMAKQALLPDERLIQWVISSARNAERKP
jgi:hypothetical protein